MTPYVSWNTILYSVRENIMALLYYFHYFLISLKYKTVNLLMKTHMLAHKDKGIYPTPT